MSPSTHAGDDRLAGLAGGPEDGLAAAAQQGPRQLALRPLSNDEWRLCPSGGRLAPGRPVGPAAIHGRGHHTLV